MGGDTALQAGKPFPVAEHGQVLIGDVGCPLLDELGDHRHLIWLGEAQPGGQALLDGRVAARPAEDEGDGGQQAGGVQPGYDVRPVRGPAPGRSLGGLAAPAGPAARMTPAAATGGAVPAGHRDLGLRPPVPLCHPHQLRVDAGPGRVGEQVIQPVPDHHVLP